MRPEQVGALFQPFNRLGQETGAQEGTGIGLVVTKHLVELMGGEIGVTSAPGTGSLFWIELLSAVPVADAPPTEAPVPASAPAVADAGRDSSQAIVLCVEDNPASLYLIQQALSSRKDIRLITASNGQTGIEMARAHLPDVILMDNNMPVLSGREAQRILRADPATANIPVIAVSASAFRETVAEGLSAGFFRYLTKPVDLAALREAVDSALEEVARRKG
jgi:CheY-like chemotaxis protein